MPLVHKICARIDQLSLIVTWSHRLHYWLKWLEKITRSSVLLSSAYSMVWFLASCTHWEIARTKTALACFVASGWVWCSLGSNSSCVNAWVDQAEDSDLAVEFLGLNVYVVTRCCTSGIMLQVSWIWSQSFAGRMWRHNSGNFHASSVVCYKFLEVWPEYIFYSCLQCGIQSPMPICNFYQVNVVDLFWHGNFFIVLYSINSSKILFVAFYFIPPVKATMSILFVCTNIFKYL